jgi:hypothetical protein
MTSARRYATCVSKSRERAGVDQPYSCMPGWQRRDRLPAQMFLQQLGSTQQGSQARLHRPLLVMVIVMPDLPSERVSTLVGLITPRLAGIPSNVAAPCGPIATRHSPLGSADVAKLLVDDGRTGIRTQERVAPLAVFKTVALAEAANRKRPGWGSTKVSTSPPDPTPSRRQSQALSGYSRRWPQCGQIRSPVSA